MYIRSRKSADTSRFTPPILPFSAQDNDMTQDQNRRQFLKTTSAVTAGAAILGSTAQGVHAAGSDLIRFVVIGCGGRGSGAADQIMNTKGNVKLVAVADAFQRNADYMVKSLGAKHKEKVDVPQDKVFTDLDGYKKAIDVECDLVVIATPPGFKPQQFEYAVNKGRHVFMEKPVATDAPGVRRVLDAVEASKKKNLMVAIGLQRRHEPCYMETIKRIHDGAIGDVVTQRVYWNGNGIWYRNRSQGQSEMAFQTNNWYHFNWLCGDQICEQHIHNLDVGCWVKNAFPVECNGMVDTSNEKVAIRRSRRSSITLSVNTRLPTVPRCSAKDVTWLAVGPKWLSIAKAPRERLTQLVGSRATTLGSSKAKAPTVTSKSSMT